MDWVRDPDALLIILRLRSLQLGDEIMELELNRRTEHPFTINNQHDLREIYLDYPRDDLIDRNKRWLFVAWRRPNKED